jgi:hypothetical protein
LRSGTGAVCRYRAATAAVWIGALAGIAAARTNDFDADASYFDLGFDVTDVVATGPDPAVVRDFLASLEPLSLRITLTTCRHYLRTPASTSWSGTKRFCRVALAISGTRAFATTKPPDAPKVRR